MQAMRPSILVVDDDPDIRESIADVLGDEGYNVRVAANGREALAELQARAPCMVVLDLMMPIMDGWQVASSMERDPRWTQIPVCIVSAWAERAPASARCVLSKPLSLQQLLDVVLKQCGPAGPPEPSVH
jgi:CheY-like chemotaxis protein